MRRQQTLCALVHQIVTEMREEGAAGSKLFHRLDGSVHGGVRGMWFVPQSIQKQDIERPQKLDGRIGNFAMVRQIGGRAETETMDRLPVGANRQRAGSSASTNQE